MYRNNIIVIVKSKYAQASAIMMLYDHGNCVGSALRSLDLNQVDSPNILTTFFFSNNTVIQNLIFKVFKYTQIELYNQGFKTLLERYEGNDLKARLKSITDKISVNDKRLRWTTVNIILVNNKRLEWIVDYETETINDYNYYLILNNGNNVNEND